MPVKEISCPNCGHAVKLYRNPLPTADVIINYGAEGAPKGVVLVRRSHAPLGWALPGGFIEYGESAETAAAREALEETGLKVRNLTQFRAYSDPDRDPRHHTLTVVFSAVAEGPLLAGDDAAEARVFAWSEIPGDLCFDHGRILGDYAAANIKKGQDAGL